MQEKHDAVKLLAQSKLDSIANMVSQAMQCKTKISLPLIFTKYCMR